MTNEKFPEAGAVAYFNYKRTDGFEVCLTLRDTTGKDLLKRLDGAIALVTQEKGTPIPLKGAGFPKKEKDYVQGRVCPKDGGKLFNTVTKLGKKFVKCENNKWDAVQQRAVGCDFVEWPETAQQQVSQPESTTGVDSSDF